MGSWWCVLSAVDGGPVHLVKLYSRGASWEWGFYWRMGWTDGADVFDSRLSKGSWFVDFWSFRLSRCSDVEL